MCFSRWTCQSLLRTEGFQGGGMSGHLAEMAAGS
jgi:hypothetical protein